MTDRDRLRGPVLLPGQFNRLPDNEKWKVFPSLQNAKWYCPKCGEEIDEPERASPFRGAVVKCCGCEAVLTRRTGGGMSDPFNWLLEPRPKLLPCPMCGSDDLSNEGHYIECYACGLKSEGIYPRPDDDRAVEIWNAMDRTQKTYTYPEVRAEMARLGARVEEEAKNYIGMLELRDIEIRKNAKLHDEIERLNARIAELEGYDEVRSCDTCFFYDDSEKACYNYTEDHCNVDPPVGVQTLKLWKSRKGTRLGDK